MLVIFAATDPAAGTKGLSAFIVERGLPGLIMGDREEKLGLRSSNTVYFSMKDLRVSVANRLGKEGDGMKIAMETLDLARPSIGALAIGLAQRCLDECVKHLHKRYPAKSFPARPCNSISPTCISRSKAHGRRSITPWRCGRRSRPFSKELAIAKTLVPQSR